MSAAVLVLVGAIVVVVSLRVLPSIFRRPPHLRKNFRGRDVIGTAGIVLIVPAVVSLLALGLEQDDVRTAAAMTSAGITMAVLGYVDDVYGSRHAGGFLGHIRELLHGRVTTGLVKAAGGAIVGVAASWVIGWRGPWLVIAAAVVALAANLMNLLDLRPGRSVKVWLPCALALLFLSGGASRAVLAVLVGGVGAFSVYELSERVMLGDTGAGLLGVVLGVAAVAVLDRTGLVVAASVLVSLTAASEVVSFTRVIEAVAPLRWVDKLGREP